MGTYRGQQAWNFALKSPSSPRDFRIASTKKTGEERSEGDLFRVGCSDRDDDHVCDRLKKRVMLG